jgi:DNA-binding IclR family transcriptional regulator
MILSKPHKHLLICLQQLSQANEMIDLMTLCSRTTQTPYAVLRGLSSLQEQGLVNARKLRLTLPGLALAQALSGRLAERTRHRDDAAEECAGWFNERPSTVFDSRRKRRAA